MMWVPAQFIVYYFRPSYVSFAMRKESEYVYNDFVFVFELIIVICVFSMIQFSVLVLLALSYYCHFLLAL